MNEDIVHVDGEPSFSEFFFEQGVHHSLEGGWGVGEPEEHDTRLEEAFIRNEGRLPFVALLDTNIIVSPSDVEFRES